MEAGAADPAPGRGPGRALWLVGLATAPFVTAFAMLAMLAPLLAFELDATPALLGLLVASMAAVPMLLAMPIGALIDRIGGHGPLALALACAILAIALLILFPSLPLLFGCQVMLGTSQLVFMVASQRMVSNLGSGRSRERDFGWYTTFQSVGQMAGPVLAGVLLDLSGFRLAYLATGALVASALLVSLLTPRSASEPIGSKQPAAGRPSGEPPTEEKAQRPAEAEGGSAPGPEEASERDLRPPAGEGRGLAGVRALLRNPGFLMAVAVSYAVLFSQSVRQSFLAVYLESLAMSGTLIGLVVSSRGLMSMLVRPAMPAIVRGLGGRSRAMLIMVGTIVLGIGLTSLFTTLPGLMFATALVGLGNGITQPLSMVAVADHVHPRQLGMALGLRISFNRLAQVIGPLLIGVVAELAGLRWVFLASAVMLLAAIPLMRTWQPAFDLAERALRKPA